MPLNHCRMGLQPLEFSDCLTDSPYFREKLHTHEKELERTNKAIKGLISECKDLLDAAKSKRSVKSTTHPMIRVEIHKNFEIKLYINKSI